MAFDSASVPHASFAGDVDAAALPLRFQFDLHLMGRLAVDRAAQFRGDDTDAQAAAAGAGAVDLDGELQVDLLHGEGQGVALRVLSGLLELPPHLADHFGESHEAMRVRNGAPPRLVVSVLRTLPL